MRACLAKTPEERWQSARDLARELKWAAEPKTAQSGTAEAKPASRLWISATVAMSAVALCLGILHFWQRVRPQPDVLKFQVYPPDTFRFDAILRGAAKISPDGRRLAFVGRSQNRSNLWIHDFDSSTSRALAGTEGASNPFWSPDSRFVAFFADEKLRRVATSGGPPQIICEAGAEMGATWSRDGVILFVPNIGDQTGLFQVPAVGGSPKRVGSLDPARGELWRRWPYFLPDGKRFLYLSHSGEPKKPEIRAASLDTSEDVSLLSADSSAVYAPSPATTTGYLLFLRDRTLMAQAFDPQKLRLIGDPIPVADNVNQGNVTRQ